MSKEKELILEAKHVTKKFPLTKGKELIANDDVSLKFYKGQTLGIVGESGCGKSTFMRMMVQLEQPTSGEILFKGKDITKMKGEELRKNRRNVQMVFQNPSTSFNPKMKVGDIICEPLMNFGLIKKKEKDAVARKYLEMVELPGDFADRYPHNMSGGQRQRVGIARAIALEPEIIFCDESTSALDVSIQKAILELLVKLQKEKNISAVKVKRVDRQASLNAYQKSFTGSFVACTKGAYDTEFAEKNNVILLEVEIPKESPSVDFQQFLSGNEYSNYIEQEVLLPPFLPLEIEEKPLNLKEKKIRDMHKKPPVGKYLLRTGNFPDYRNEITASKDELYERLMRDKEEAAACLQSMNEGNWEDEYQNYIKWKEDLHNYLKLVYSDLWYGENTNE